MKKAPGLDCKASVIPIRHHCKLNADTVSDCLETLLSVIELVQGNVVRMLVTAGVMVICFCTWELSTHASEVDSHASERGQHGHAALQVINRTERFIQAQRQLMQCRQWLRCKAAHQ